MSNNSFTFSDIRPGHRILLIVLGSWEQHGPHLPFDTDSIIIDAVVSQAFSEVNQDRFLVAPTIPITASDEHDGFPGGLSTGTQALADYVVAMCRSASWALEVCIVNGHGGNTDALSRIDSALEHEKIAHSIWSLPSYQGGDMHAGHTETSLMMHIAPTTVRHELIQSGNTGSADTLIPAMRESGIISISSNGILGDPTTASAQHGAKVLKLYVKSLVAHLTTHTLHIRPDPMA